MSLAGAESLCEKNQKEIVSKDRRCKTEHRAVNKGLNDVYHYKLDGELIKQQTCCDFLLLNDTKKRAYLIELKGSDVIKGIKQLEHGERHFRTELDGYRILYRLVCTRAKTHNMESNTVRKFRAKHREDFLCKVNIIMEDISE